MLGERIGGNGADRAAWAGRAAVVLQRAVLQGQGLVLPAAARLKPEPAWAPAAACSPGSLAMGRVRCSSSDGVVTLHSKWGARTAMRWARARQG